MLGKRKIKENIFYWSILIIPLIQVLIFYVYVNFNSILLSFKVYDGLNEYHWDFTENFKRVFQELKGYTLQTSVKNSLLIFVIGFLFSNVLSLICAFWFYRKMPLSKYFRFVLFLPTIISSVVLVLIFKIIVEDGYVAIVQALTGETVYGLLTNEKTQFITIIAYSILIAYGSNILLYSGAMAGINESIIEASRLDGANIIQELIHVVVPGIWQTFVTLTITGIAGIFINQLNLYTIYSSNLPTNKLSTVGYYLFSKTNSNMLTMSEYPYLAALGLFFTIIILPFPILTRKLLLKFGPRED